MRSSEGLCLEAASGEEKDEICANAGIAKVADGLK
jgi:hypothetical protein